MYVVKAQRRLLVRTKYYDYGNVTTDQIDFLLFYIIYRYLWKAFDGLKGVIMIHSSSLTEIQVVFYLITGICP